jgi:hypothetical protein
MIHIFLNKTDDQSYKKKSMTTNISIWRECETIEIKMILLSITTIAFVLRQIEC